jgi:hypothetical protein
MAKIGKTVSGENALMQYRRGHCTGILRRALNSLRRFERLRMTGFGGDTEKKNSCRRFAQMHADQNKSNNKTFETQRNGGRGGKRRWPRLEKPCPGRTP